MKKSYAELEYVFYSGGNSFRSDKQALVDIKYLLSSKLIMLQKAKIGGRAGYYQLADKIHSGVINTYDIAGGGVGHEALKLMASDYLNSRGYHNLEFETEFEGYRPDIKTDHGKILIECGTVNPDKLFKYFKNKDLRELIILPYPEEGARILYAYIFKPSGDLAEFLCFLETERVRAVNLHHSSKKS